MEFTPIKNTKLSQQVIQQIKEMIYDGSLKKGEKLPSERDLAVKLGVSRTSIREAFSALEILGLIASRHGEGTFINDNPLGGQILEPLSLLFMLEDAPSYDFIAVRAMLECECAGLAAQFASKDDLERLQECIVQFQKGGVEQQQCIDADRAFHQGIARASRNTLLYHLYTAISDVLNRHIAQMRLAIVQQEDNIPVLNTQHDKIYQAIAKQDSREARMVMQEHMQFIRQQI